MYKLCRSGLVLLATAACLAPLAAQASTIVAITTSAPTVAAGGSFTLDVDVTGAADLYGFQFDLSFDPTAVSAGAASEGALLPSGGTTFFIAGTNDNTNGVVTATADTLIGALSGVNGSGTLASFVFTAGSPGVSEFSLSNVELLDSALNPIDTTLANGSISVTPVPLPESSWLLAAGLLLLIFTWTRLPGGAQVRLAS
jgi:adhesin HecA-like repeat protein